MEIYNLLHVGYQTFCLFQVFVSTAEEQCLQFPTAYIEWLSTGFRTFNIIYDTPSGLQFVKVVSFLFQSILACKLSLSHVQYAGNAYDLLIKSLIFYI
jgi:hypothetical protein